MIPMQYKNAIKVLITILCAGNIYADTISNNGTEEFFSIYLDVNKSDAKLSIDEVTNMISRAIRIPDYPEKPDWETQKHEKYRCLLLAMTLADASVDHSFDFRKLPFMHIIPPANSDVSPRTPRERVLDENIRKNYEELIKANEIYAVTYRTQYRLHDQLNRILNYTKAFAMHYYGDNDRAKADLLFQESAKKCLGGNLLIESWKNGVPLIIYK